MKKSKYLIVTLILLLSVILNFEIAQPKIESPNIGLIDMVTLPFAWAQEDNEPVECDTYLDGASMNYEQCGWKLVPTIQIDYYTCLSGDYGSCKSGSEVWEIMYNWECDYYFSYIEGNVEPIDCG